MVLLAAEGDRLTGEVVVAEEGVECGIHEPAAVDGVAVRALPDDVTGVAGERLVAAQPAVAPVLREQVAGRVMDRPRGLGAWWHPGAAWMTSSMVRICSA
jgi:hypothetical protein